MSATTKITKLLNDLNTNTDNNIVNTLFSDYNFHLHYNKLDTCKVSNFVSSATSYKFTTVERVFRNWRKAKRYNDRKHPENILLTNSKVATIVDTYIKTIDDTINSDKHLEYCINDLVHDTRTNEKLLAEYVEFCKIVLDSKDMIYYRAS